MKRRRLNFSRMKSATQKANELREGKTYQSNVDADTTNASDIQVIPAPIDAPVPRKVDSALSDMKTVYFDLETTSLAKKCDITQLAAVHGDRSFNQYVMPEEPITKKASEATGISVQGGKMYYRNKPVKSVSVSRCLSQFLDWCSGVGNIVLVAHNCQFDAYRLAQHVRKEGLNDKLAPVLGFVDTLQMFRALYKKDDETWTNHKQETVVRNILGTSYAAHNALEDARTLQQAVQKSKATDSDLLAHSFTLESVKQSLVRDDAKANNIGSLQVLVDKKACSQCMADKMASSGLSMDHLKLAYSRNGEDGIKSLFMDKDSNARVRVTNSKKIIEAVLAHVKEV